ncbi:MAG TPA: hypothetical protein VNM43_04475 [Dehalococcoidia bacterium]|nr:hypothetical protein [Dehalococcoidia bacterium]
MAVAILLLAVSTTFNGLLATGVIGGGDGFDVNAYRAGVQEGFGDCLGGKEPDATILLHKTTVAGEEWLYGTTPFAFGYDVGFTACQFEQAGHQQGYDEGYDDGYSEGSDSGYLSGYTDGYSDGQVDLCQAIVTTYNYYGIALPVDCSSLY